MHTMIRRLAWITFALPFSMGTTWAGDLYVQTNLISNGGVPNTVVDPNLLNPWGLSYSTTSPFWISDQASNVNGSSVTTVYSITTNANPTSPPSSSGPLLTVGVVNQNNAPPSTNGSNGVTGQVNTTAPGITTSPTTDFQLNGARASFIFANLDGSISAWNGGTHTTIMTTVAGASFTGLAIGNASTGAAQLYAADQKSTNIDIFNNQFQMTGTFTDPNAAKFGYSAFNVQDLLVNGVQTLFVTFANRATSGGIVDEFTTNGTLIKTLISDTGPNATLDAPWGLAIAPAGWGQFGGDLLVGNNNGPGEINAYSLDGTFQGTLMLSTGRPFAESDLWALSFGNGGGAGSTNTLFFTSSTAGLFGSIQSIPEPSSAVLGLIAAGVLVGSWHWKNRRHVATS